MADEPENEALKPAEAGAADADSPTAEVVAEAPADKPKRTRTAKPKAEEPVAEEPVAAAEATPEPVPAPEPAAATAPEPVAEAAAAPAPAAKRAPAKKPAAKKPAAKKAAPKKERGTYVRTPAGEPDPGLRKERRGLVVSSAEDKTITVRVDLMMAHPKYKKIMRRTSKFMANV